MNHGLNEKIRLATTQSVEAVNDFFATNAGFAIDSPITDRGCSALSYACVNTKDISDEGKVTSILQALLDKGADINMKDKRSKLPIHHAAEADNVAALKLLLKVDGDNINTITEGRETPLHGSIRGYVRYEKIEAIETLILAGANPCIKNGLGETPVDIARKMLGKTNQLGDYLDKAIASWKEE